MDEVEFVCKRCGKCCKENWEIIVDFQEDIIRWINERRFDILKHVVLNPKFILNPVHYQNNPQWIIDSGHILFGDVAYRCPFLDEATEDFSARCRIHETRPMGCRRFPYDEQGKVRADILDVCMGSIFYHSRNAEDDGMGFMTYISLRGASKDERIAAAPDKNELKKIARSFRDKGLKVMFISDTGLSITEQLLTDHGSEEIQKLAQ
jgi:Fe-S-cluster containining protein